jgi:hypothetical protein
VCLLFGELHSWETDILAWLGWWFERLVWIWVLLPTWSSQGAW